MSCNTSLQKGIRMKPWYNHPPEVGLPMLREAMVKAARHPFRLIGAFVAMLSLLLVGAAVPASAAESLPSTANGYRFWTGTTLCVDGSAINGSYYQVAYLAQQWNLATSYIALDYSDDCVADGYPPSRRMVVGTYYNATNKACLYLTNGYVDTVGQFNRWTSGPGVYINTAYTDCVGSQARRDHFVTQAIGYLLGADNFLSAGYNSRVMNNTDWSITNVTRPDQYTSALLTNIYAGLYG